MKCRIVSYFCVFVAGILSPDWVEGQSAVKTPSESSQKGDASDEIAEACLAADEKSAQVKFQIRLLTVDANEGIAAGDVDGDGVVDLVAGRHWYRGGDWAPRPLRQIEDWNGYVRSNGDFLFDVNQDGRIDVIAGSFLGTELAWYENPGPEALRLGQLWERHVWIDTQNASNEGQLFEDIDGDGRPEWIVNSWKKDVPAMVWRLVNITDETSDEPEDAKHDKKENPASQSKPAAFKLIGHELGPRGNGHGLAEGDLNGDGRTDVLMGQGWYEQPAENPWGQSWTFHPDWDLHSSLPMIVVDLDEDGDSDLILGNGHDFGLFWWESLGGDPIQWKKHEIDSSYSQPHALAWHDIDGDKQPDLITGKRYFAHNGDDPGGMEMPCLYYYKWDRKSRTFQRNIVEEGHIGVGLQIVVEDLNGDGCADLAVAGKSGTYLIETLHEPRKESPK